MCPRGLRPRPRPGVARSGLGPVILAPHPEDRPVAAVVVEAAQDGEPRIVVGDEAPPPHREDGLPRTIDAIEAGAWTARPTESPRGAIPVNRLLSAESESHSGFGLKLGVRCARQAIAPWAADGAGSASRMLAGRRVLAFQTSIATSVWLARS